MDLEIHNRLAIVTGSSQGIGKAIAMGLAREGAKLTICSRNKDLLKKAAEDIGTATGAEILPVQADLTYEEDTKAMVKAAANRFGRVDILTNNTGGPPSALFLETLDNDWHKTLNSLLMSVVNCCREAIPHMKEHKWGRIVNMTSFAVK